MAPQPENQQTMSGPSSSTPTPSSLTPLPLSDGPSSALPTSALAATNPVPDATPPATSTGPQRNKVVMNWKKNTTSKTAKCRVCDIKCKNFCFQCGSCQIRICCECSEPEGERSEAHKAVAADQLQNGCWCGFTSKMHPDFKNRMPPPVNPGEAKKVPSTSPNKRASGKKSAKKAKVEKESASLEIGGGLGQQDDPFIDGFMAENSAFTTTRDRRTQPAGQYRQAEILEPSKPEQNQQALPEQTSTQAPEPEKTTPNNEEQPAQNAASANKSDSSSLSPPPPSDELSPPTSDEKPVTRKRKTTRAGAAEQDNGSLTPPAKKKAKISKTRASAPKPEEAEPSNTTVIIGAGIIGMFTALELAKKVAEKGQKRTIIVIDIHKKPFELASGHSTGILSIRDIKEQWGPLIKAAMDEWNNLTDSSEFRKTIKLNTGIFTTAKTEKEVKPHPLSWLQDEANESTIRDGCSNGFVSSSSLATWLRQQCENYGVQFHFEFHPSEIFNDKANNLSGITIQHVDNPGVSKKLECTNLILAAGPFTPDLFTRLFEKTALDLRNYMQVSQWVRLGGCEVKTPNGRSQGVTIPHVDQGETPISGNLSIIAKPSKRIITVSACEPAYRAQRVNVQHTLEPPGTEKLADAITMAAISHLSPAAQGAESEGVSFGGAYVSTGNGRNPIMGRVPIAENVFIAYGFGMHGTTLAPGVGKVMAELVCGEETSVDLDAFGVSEAKGYKGKGKAKA